MVIVGLGNPGQEYNNTPHNMGFMAVDNFQKENNFPDFKLVKKYNCLISQGVIGGQKIILAKPQTFMNQSGQAVKKITNYELRMRNKDISKLEMNSCLVVIHDDIAFSLGQVKVAKNRGANHHKGVESIIASLENKNFIRIRMGANTQEQKPSSKKQNLKDTVLKKWTASQKIQAQNASKKASQILRCILTDGLEETMTQYNKSA